MKFWDSYENNSHDYETQTARVNFEIEDPGIYFQMNEKEGIPTTAKLIPALKQSTECLKSIIASYLIFLDFYKKLQSFPICCIFSRFNFYSLLSKFAFLTISK